MTLRVKNLAFSLIGLLCFTLPSAFAQLADGHSKFFGNIAPLTGVPSGFATYWNQLTPEKDFIFFSMATSSIHW